MLYIVIAVFIVLIIMNIFMLLVLKQIAASTGRQIEKDAVRLFSVYDRILEDRSQKLEELDDQILDQMERLKELENSGKIVQSAPVLGNATVVTGRYRDQSFAQDYRRVKEAFQMDAAQAVSDLKAQYSEKDREAESTRAVVLGILNKFSFDTRYELSTLSEELQMELVEQFLEGEERSLYEAYQEDCPGTNAQAFFEWLNEINRILDRSLTVRMADGSTVEGLEGHVNIEYVPDICEGFQIKQGSRIYDYSI